MSTKNADRLVELLQERLPGVLMSSDRDPMTGETVVHLRKERVFSFDGPRDDFALEDPEVDVESLASALEKEWRSGETPDVPLPQYLVTFPSDYSQEALDRLIDEYRRSGDMNVVIAEEGVEVREFPTSPWRSTVDEMLPEWKRILVWFRPHGQTGKSYTTIGHNLDGIFHDEIDRNFTCEAKDVPFWMPLPEAPR